MPIRAAVCGRVGQPSTGLARLPRAEQLAPAAQPQILLRDAEAVIGLAHQREARTGRLAERRAAQEQADRMLAPASDAPAQLVQLGEAETLCSLDDDQGGVGYVHPHLDHRGGDQHRRLALLEGRHRSVLVGALHAAMNEPHLLAEDLAQARGTRFGGGIVAILALLDQRAHPIGLPPRRDMAPEAGHDLVEPLDRDHPRLDRLAARRHLVEPAHVHLAILGERQRAGDRGRGHHQHVWGVSALGRQHQSLRDAEAVLLVHHNEAQRLVGDGFLENGVSADQDVDRSVRQPHQGRLTRAPFSRPVRMPTVTPRGASWRCNVA